MSATIVGGERRGERLSFFRQSGWMLVANVVSGLFLVAVHAAAGRMPDEAEYSLFTTLLDSLYLLMIPAGGLQFVFAQLTAAAVDDARRAQTRKAVVQVLTVLTGVWCVVALVSILGREPLLGALKIRNPAALWLTLLVGLTGIWYPVFAGLLQGSQRFGWLGATSIVLGFTRFAAIAVIVGVFGGLAAGALTGVLCGSAAALAIAVWSSRPLWSGPRAHFSWGPLGRVVLALTAGIAATNIMLAADSLLVRATFDENETAFYMAAGRVARGLVVFTTPLALVLFPRVARSAATGEPTGVLRLALGATLGTGLAAALFCTLAPTLVLRILFAGNEAFLPAAELVPWFCWCMLPLTAAYTLINDLLARAQFVAVPWLLAVAVGYALTLASLRDRLGAMPLVDAFRTVMSVLGGFSLLLLGVAIVFSIRRRAGGMAARRA